MMQHPDQGLEQALVAWLREGSDGLPDRDAVLGDLRRRLPSTPRRGLSWWARRRAATTRHDARGVQATTRLLTGPLTILAAALVVIFGGFLLATQPFERVAVTVPGAETESFSPDSPPPSVVFPRAGWLPPGWYGAIVGGVSFVFRVPENGFESSGEGMGLLHADSHGPMDGIYRGSTWLGLQTVANVYADPCVRVPSSPPSGPSAGDLAAALAAIPGLEASAPTDVLVAGYPAKHLQLTLGDDIPCRRDLMHLWYGDEQDVGGSSRRLRAEDPSIDVWIADVDGVRLVIDWEATPGGIAPASTIIASIRVMDIPPDVLGYVDRVLAICTAAGDRFESHPDVAGGFRELAPELPTLDATAAHAEAAVMISDAAFAELDTLIAPEAMRLDVATFRDPLEAAIDVLRQVPAAARAGDTERVSTLMTEAYLLSNTPWFRADESFWDERGDPGDGSLGSALLAPSFSGCVLPSGGG